MESYFGNGERRITLQLLSYWEKLRKGRTMPQETDIDPDDIAELWENCFLVHVADLHKEGYNYTYLGDGIKKAYQGELDAGVSGLVSPNAEKLADCYMEILNTAKPLIDEGEFTNAQGDLVKYRQCMLPLGRDGRVEAIFGGMRYKLFAHS